MVIIIPSRARIIVIPRMMLIEDRLLIVVTGTTFPLMVRAIKTGFALCLVALFIVL